MQIMPKCCWDLIVKPKRTFRGYLNIKGIVTKTEQLKQLLLDSNFNYLCLSETWTPYNVLVYQVTKSIEEIVNMLRELALCC